MFSGIAELQPLFQKTRVRPCRFWAGARRLWKYLEALSQFAGGSGPFGRLWRCEGHFLRGSAVFRKSLHGRPFRILLGFGSFWTKVSESLNGSEGLKVPKGSGGFRSQVLEASVFRKVPNGSHRCGSVGDPQRIHPLKS